MDLNKYISDNLDYIIENQNDFVPMAKNKQVQFNLNNSNNLNNLDNLDNLDNSSDISGMYDEELDESNEYYYFDVFNYDNGETSNIYLNDDYDSEFNSKFKYNYNTTKLYGDAESEIKQEENQDDYLNDNIGDLFQELYENNNFDSYKSEYFSVKNCIEKKNINLAKLNNQIDINSSEYGCEENLLIDSLENDDGYYYFNLMNLFVKYYNNKFDKIEHLFSGVEDLKKGTSFQMELFMDSIIEYKLVKKIFFPNNSNNSNNSNNLNDSNDFEDLNIDSKVMKFIFDNDSNNLDNKKKIADIFERWEEQIYLLDIDNRCNYISPSLIVCLNWIYENNMFNENWNIYNLKNI